MALNIIAVWIVYDIFPPVLARRWDWNKAIYYVANADMMSHINSVQFCLWIYDTGAWHFLCPFIFWEINLSRPVFIQPRRIVIQKCALTDFWKMYVPLIYHPLPQAFHSQTGRISKAIKQKEDYENFVHSVNQTETPLWPNAGMLFSLKPSNKCLSLYPCK